MHHSKGAENYGFFQGRMIGKLGTKRIWNLAVSLLLQWRRRCEFIWGGMIGYSAAGLSKLRDLIISLLLPRDSQKTFYSFSGADGICRLATACNGVMIVPSTAPTV